MIAETVEVRDGTSTDEVVLTFSKLNLQVGDVVLMKFQYHLEPEIVKELTKRLIEALPTGVRCIVADPTIDVTVHRPEPADGEE